MELGPKESGVLHLFSPKRSFCPHCKAALHLKHLIPILSFVGLRGRCHFCQTLIGWRYLLVEGFCVGLFLWAFFQFSVSFKTLAVMEFVAFMLVLSWVDLDFLILPDALNYGLLWSGFIWNSLGVFTSLKQAIWGAIFGYGLFWVLRKSFQVIRHQEGLGLGDLKLAAALGAWFGVEALPRIFVEAGVLGLGLAIIWRSIQKKSAEVPFGPALLIAGFSQFIFR
jgi:leader peptidase (prepilin peptidase) / N-methyltransferase